MKISGRKLVFGGQLQTSLLNVCRLFQLAFSSELVLTIFLSKNLSISSRISNILHNSVHDILMFPCVVSAWSGKYSARTVAVTQPQ